MSDVVIRVSNLGKQYKIGARQQRTDTLRDALVGSVRGLAGRLRGNGHRSEANSIWALKDVSFEVKRGEVLGVIGRNGAGKSTLLKILSRITEPTTGEVDLHGRVASLLEVGTGFHAELTGRENIFLNGAILGMKRREIQRNFDEIVDFAGVEKFVDTPVKHYSSGMYLRLAFAVAAHLEPEILIVDEVLAVGDAEFQKKCLGKMGEVARAGRTVVFVSHNLTAVQRLCGGGILLESGRVATGGSIHSVLQAYRAEGNQALATASLRQRTDRDGDGSLKFVCVRFTDAHRNPVARITSGQDIILQFEYVSDYAMAQAEVNVAFNIMSADGNLLTNLNSKDTGQLTMPIGRHGHFDCYWPKFNLRSGDYQSVLYCAINGVIVDWLQSAFQFRVDDGDYFDSGSLFGRDQGDFIVSHAWSGHIFAGNEA